jgi:hypothetical protein
MKQWQLGHCLCGQKRSGPQRRDHGGKLAGIHELATVMEKRITDPTETILARCSDEVRRLWEADLIISRVSNFVRLTGDRPRRRLFFMLMPSAFVCTYFDKNYAAISKPIRASTV